MRIGVIFLLCDTPVPEFYVPTFENVGRQKSEAGESPKRKNRTCKTSRTFEINVQMFYKKKKVFSINWHNTNVIKCLMVLKDRETNYKKGHVWVSWKPINKERPVFAGLGIITKDILFNWAKFTCCLWGSAMWRKCIHSQEDRKWRIQPISPYACWNYWPFLKRKKKILSACSRVRSRVPNPLRQRFQQFRITTSSHTIQETSPVSKTKCPKNGDIPKICVKLSLYIIITFLIFIMFLSRKECHFEILPLVDMKPYNLFPHH